MVIHFAYVLVDNSVYSLDFVLESCYCCCMMLSFVLGRKFVLIVLFVYFLSMVR